MMILLPVIWMKRVDKAFGDGQDGQLLGGQGQAQALNMERHGGENLREKKQQ